MKLRHLGIAAVVTVAVFASLGEASSSGDGSSSSGGTSASEAPADSSTSEDAPADEGAADGAPAADFGIGQPAPDGKFEFTVSGVECGKKKVGGDMLNEKAQGQFCLVTMSVKNVGDEAQTFDAGSQKGITSAGATVDADGTASMYANDDGNSFLEEINPGNSLKDIVVVYDIAEDQTLEAVELHDSFMSDGVVVALK